MGVNEEGNNRGIADGFVTGEGDVDCTLNKESFFNKSYTHFEILKIPK
jgi:hypothetical protein